MKIISTPKKLEGRFKDLLLNYDHFSGLSAWASAGEKFYPYKVLRAHQNKIEKMVVGTHMYQTDPRFIEEFLHHSGFRFRKPLGNLFHPKLYLFYNTPKDGLTPTWTLLIGSANFTYNAFKKNQEIMFEMHFAESEESFFYEILQTIEDLWTETEDFSDEYLSHYRKLHGMQKEKIQSLTGEYEGEDQNTMMDILSIPVCIMNWKSFMETIYQETIHKIEDRIFVLQEAKRLFSIHSSFSDMTEEERKFIAGISHSDKRSGIFGSMTGAGLFKNAIINNDKNISDALDCIPIEGDVTKKDYLAFVEKFSNIERSGLATATRLLAMKRPDIFLCFDSENKKNLSRDFGISQSVNYEQYWDRIIARIQDSVWWKVEAPIEEEERMIYEGRAAFLDALYFGGKG